jgi:uncharacterized lipoprotein NlpE involved in copper resistance
MKKIITLFGSLLVLAGCSNDNKIVINNLADGNIYFNFRAQQYEIASDQSVTIADIPNGTYVYATTYQIPSGAKTWSITGDAASGSLMFDKKSTRILLLYASTMDQNGAYNVNVTWSTTNSSTSTASLTGP